MSPERLVEAYFDKLEGAPRDIANRLRGMINERWPHLSVKPAWGVPCWSGNERIVSIIAHKDRCNLQLWSGARLARQFPDRIEGTGKALRHVKVRSLGEIDDELIDIVEHAIRLDEDDPRKVR